MADKSRSEGKQEPEQPSGYVLPDGQYLTVEQMEAKLKELKVRLIEANDLQSAASLLHWDQTTYMPPGGAAARGRQLATLRRLAHEKLTDPAIGKLLDELQPYQKSLPYDSDDARLIRVARRQYDRAVKVPASFMAEIARHSAASYAVWEKARPADDFPAVRWGLLHG